MPSRSGQRSYRPKVKGCYECSQRRISCDRAEPQCSKCITKGLKCSGLDTRYRFTEGMASRGKWIGRTIQSVYEECHGSAASKQQTFPDVPNEKRPGQRIKQNIDKRKSAQYSREVDILRVLDSKTQADDVVEFEPIDETVVSLGFLQDTDTFLTQAAGSLSDGSNLDHQDSIPHILLPPLSDSLDLSSPGNAIVSWDEISHIFGDDDIVHPETNDEGSLDALGCVKPLSFEAVPDNIPSWKRRLLLHYSDWIAGDMIAIDGRHNGWRYLVLPMAHSDELVMDAVLTVSAFHLFPGETSLSSWNKATEVPFNRCRTMDKALPELLYERTIQGLQKRRNLSIGDHEANKLILITILVLLSAVQVKGGEEFPTLHGMMQAVIRMLGGEGQLGGSDLGDFMVRQIRKIHVYAAPLISEQAGCGTLSSQADWNQVFECLEFCSQSKPEHAATAALIADILQQAHDIYLSQVCHDPLSPYSIEALEESIRRVERFKHTLEAYPKGAPGGHALVWATFMAASDCLLEEHKAFFEAALIRFYSRSRFTNILRGLEYLRYIWASRTQGASWTRLLPQSRLFLA